jgi:hypothetical protein
MSDAGAARNSTPFGDDFGSAPPFAADEGNGRGDANPPAAAATVTGLFKGVFKGISAAAKEAAQAAAGAVESAEKKGWFSGGK